MIDSSSKFKLLHKDIQRWVFEQKWTSLREIQELAIEPILGENCDVILSASTASGKTEAAFLPAMSKLREESQSGLGIICLSPLKALINDQFRRLESLGDVAKQAITPWHGDVSLSVKKNFQKNPQGALIITPESLESLLLNKGNWCRENFKNLHYIIIDEFHSFIGSVRGRQLLSLLMRLDFMTKKTIPRLALSATLGDLEKISHYLRPQGNFPSKILNTYTKTDLLMEMRGYQYLPTRESTKPKAKKTKDTKSKIAKTNDTKTKNTKTEDTKLEDTKLSIMIAGDLFKLLRGKNNLIFANTRSNTETYAFKLNEKCLEAGVPNEFFPHHGNLSRQIREDLEKRLQENLLPTTAICTMTLELGIDIGHVDTIAQVGPPQSIASLRQRLGRSGRRGKPAVLRFFVSEYALGPDKHITDKLRLNVFQNVAMVSLLFQKWYEPPNEKEYHFSTLIQQTLSIIGQYGGVTALELWVLLCQKGPFELISQAQFEEILRSLGTNNLITQSKDGLLIIGDKGEILVSKYSFYSAFNTPEEYTLESEGKTLGSLPITSPLSSNQDLVFAGRNWEIIDIFPESKHITLKPAGGGKTPLFSGKNQMLHGRIREEMFKIYLEGKIPTYLNDSAKDLFTEGLKTFKSLRLKDTFILDMDGFLYLFPWMGDKATHALSSILRLNGIGANAINGIIEIKNWTKSEFLSKVHSILKLDKPKEEELLTVVTNTIIEKYDKYVPTHLLALDYASKMFDIDQAWKWLEDLS